MHLLLLIKTHLNNLGSFYWNINAESHEISMTNEKEFFKTNADSQSIVNWYEIFENLKKAPNLPSRDFELCEVIEQIETFDIRDVEFIFCSRSPLHEYENLDEFAKRRCSRWIKDKSVKNIQQRLKHPELRLFDYPIEKRDKMYGYDWLDGLIWHNNGGSHNFATIRYLAKKLSYRVEIETRTKRHKLIRHKVINFDKKYAIFILQNNTHLLTQELRRNEINFAMYYFSTLKNDGVWAADIYVIPRDSKRQEVVLQILAAIGMKAINLTKTLLS